MGIRRPRDQIHYIEREPFEKGVELVLDLNGIDQRKLWGDHARLRQVITTLVNNAIKFTPQGHVIVRATLTPPHNGERLLTINVEDTGIGMSKETLEKLFQAPQKGDNKDNAQSYAGPGLGLAIVERLTHLMGGRISVTSTPNEGSIFTATAKLGANLPYESAHPPRTLTKYNALVVDNVNASRQATKDALEILGAKVTATSSLADALSYCERMSQNSEAKQAALFDLFFIDERLSTPESIESIAQISIFLKQTKQGAWPIIYLGDITQELDANTTSQHRYYILKPILPTMLEATCKMVLEDDKALAPPALLMSDHTAPVEAALHPAFAHNPPPSGAHSEALPQTQHSKNLTEKANTSAPADATSAIDRPTEHPSEKVSVKVLLVEDNVINQQVTLGVLEECDMGAALF